MPSGRWAISCRNCKKAFPHSEIRELHAITDYLGLPEKPEFPAGGQELECPHCKSKGTYQRTDLWYEAAVNGSL
jgi:hypothetical protein